MSTRLRIAGAMLLLATLCLIAGLIAFPFHYGLGMGLTLSASLLAILAPKPPRRDV